MAVFLDEDQVAADPIVIAYPHLLLCMGVTVLMSDGSLIGAHFSNIESEATVGKAMKELIDLTPATMQCMYMTGNLKVHFSHGGGNHYAKASAIGYSGNVLIFDTEKLNPKDGTFVKITSLGPSRNCVIEYRLNEEMRYQTEMSRDTKIWKTGPKAKHPVTTVASNPLDGAPLHEAKLLVDLHLKRV